MNSNQKYYLFRWIRVSTILLALSAVGIIGTMVVADRCDEELAANVRQILIPAFLLVAVSGPITFPVMLCLVAREGYD
jgi:hypothetical protein